MQRVHEPEFTQLATRVATALKAQKLRGCMNEDAVALYSLPTHDELVAIKKAMRLIEEAGYTIVRGEG